MPITESSSRTTIPRASARERDRARADRLGRYPTRAAYVMTRRRVFSLTPGRPLSAQETEEIERRSSRARSEMVGRAGTVTCRKAVPTAADAHAHGHPGSVRLLLPCAQPPSQPHDTNDHRRVVRTTLPGCRPEALPISWLRKHFPSRARVSGTGRRLQLAARVPGPGRRRHDPRSRRTAGSWTRPSRAEPGSSALRSITRASNRLLSRTRACPEIASGTRAKTAPRRGRRPRSSHR